MSGGSEDKVKRPASEGFICTALFLACLLGATVVDDRKESASLTAAILPNSGGYERDEVGMLLVRGDRSWGKWRLAFSTSPCHACGTVASSFALYFNAPSGRQVLDREADCLGEEYAMCLSARREAHLNRLRC